MISYKEANELLLSNHKDSIVISTMDAGDKFIIAIEPNNLKKGQYVLDALFTVNKRTKEIKEYSPVMDPKEYKEAMKHEVYSIKYS